MATRLTRKTPLVQALTATIMVAVAALLPLESYAQNNDVRSLSQRLERMERDINTLSDAVYRGKTPDRQPPAYATPSSSGNNPGLTADMQVRLTEMENSVRQLTGQIEGQNFKIRQLQDKLETVLSDMEVRFNQMEQNASPAPSMTQAPSSQNGVDATTLNPDEQTAAPQSVTSAPVPVTKNELASGTAAQMYDNAFQHIRAGNYAKAEEGMKTFLAKYPKDNLAPNAEYWLGETYYVRGQYEQAAQAFARGYQNHPKSTKAPDNLLKLALSLGGLKRTEDACLALQQLQNDFPSAGQSIIERVKREKSRLGCQ